MRRFLRICLAAFLLVLLASNLYHTQQGFLNWHRAIAFRTDFQAKLKKLRQQRDDLKTRVAQLESNPLTQERLVRQLGYIKPGEKVYRFVKRSR